MTYAGNVVFVPRDLDLCPFDSKINACPGLMVYYVSAKFGNFRCIDFLYIVWKNRQTDRQTDTYTPLNSLFT